VRHLFGEAGGEAAGADLDELRAQLTSLPRDEALLLVQQLLTQHVAGIVGLAPGKLAVDQSLLDLGMDSLMLVELQMGLEKHFGVQIPMIEMMDMTSVAKLARRIADHLGGSPAASEEPAPDTIPTPAEPELDDALERLLAEELDRAQESLLRERA
jgi:acyl carrier protein